MIARARSVAADVVVVDATSRVIATTNRTATIATIRTMTQMRIGVRAAKATKMTIVRRSAVVAAVAAAAVADAVAVRTR